MNDGVAGLIGLIATSGFLVGIAIGLFLGSQYGNQRVLEEGFKEGQIQCAVGEMKYELVTEPDSTRIWKKKP